jgi:hypothetical protein
VPGIAGGDNPVRRRGPWRCTAHAERHLGRACAPGWCYCRTARRSSLTGIRLPRRRTLREGTAHPVDSLSWGEPMLGVAPTLRGTGGRHSPVLNRATPVSGPGYGGVSGGLRKPPPYPPESEPVVATQTRRVTSPKGRDVDLTSRTCPLPVCRREPILATGSKSCAFGWARNVANNMG